MVSAMDGSRVGRHFRAARRLTHAVLALVVLVQPGCMCGCSAPAARMAPRNGDTISGTERPEISPANAGTCCPHCSTATEDHRPVSSVQSY